MARPTATILIVDDEQPLVRVVALALETAGYQPLLAYTAAEGLAILERESVDLALLDVGLPDLGGLEVCRRLRAVPREPYLPVLMLAEASPKERLAGFAAGADDYVPKPVHIEELLARVGVWLAVRQRETALRASLRAEREARLASEERAVQAAAGARVVQSLVHRMNQSLTEVIGYAELLLAVDTAPATAEYARRILTSGRELAELLRPFGTRGGVDTLADGESPAASTPSSPDEAT